MLKSGDGRGAVNYDETRRRRGGALSCKCEVRLIARAGRHPIRALANIELSRRAHDGEQVDDACMQVARLASTRARLIEKGVAPGRMRSAGLSWPAVLCPLHTKEHLVVIKSTAVLSLGGPTGAALEATCP